MGKVFRMEILFDPATQRIGLKGPLEEPELCYLGLEMARREIEKMNRHRVMSVPAATLPKMPTLRDLKGMLKNGS